MATKSWADALRGVVDELLEDDDVYVGARVDSNKGASADDVGAAEAALGAPLPEALRSLYAQLNGFAVAWVSRKDWGQSALRLPGTSFDKARSRRIKDRTSRGFGRFEKNYFDPWTLDHRVTGYLYLQPLKTLVKNKAWNKFRLAAKKPSKGLDVTVLGQSMPLNDFYERLAVLDPYTASEHAFLYRDGDAPMQVLRLANNNEYVGDAAVPADAYLEHIISTHLRIDARKALFAGAAH